MAGRKKTRLEPLSTRTTPPPGTGLFHRRPHPGPTPEVARALQLAVNADPRAVASYAATPTDLRVVEALLAGCVGLGHIADYASLEPTAVKDVLVNNVAMAWISARVHELFAHRAALIDAAVFARAATGDVNAARLFYERAEIFRREQTINVNHTHGFDLRSLSDRDLARVIAERQRMLPAEFEILSREPLPGPEGTGAPVPPGPVALLPPPPSEAPEAAPVPQPG